MNIVEFDRKRWHTGSFVSYNGSIYKVIAIHFAEALIYLSCGEWVHCEKVKPVSTEEAQSVGLSPFYE